MDKIDNYNHTITLVERKSIVISGVKKIENFDDEEFLIESTMGYIIVKGNGLELLKLDTLSGNVSIKGKINSIAYIEDKKPSKEEGMFSKLFK
ncbi:MAG: sporulation protein YabP [Bacilli bacterium]|jgi:sporulation protein YabP|nr:sporulation protein YabP [Bacilli bacterium]